MSSRFRPPALVALLLAIAALVGRPQPAQACIWNWVDNFSPFPPCEVEDNAVAQWVQDTNENLIGKLGTIASKIYQVKQEVAGWQHAYETARDFESLLRRAYGDLTANPVPSMIAEYNRSSPMADFVRVRQDGGLSVTFEAVDIMAVGDSVLAMFQDSLGLARIYDYAVSDFDYFVKGKIVTAEALANSLQKELTDFGRLKESLDISIDSLNAQGQRNAGRYAGNASTAGLSEAKISNLSATLSRLRGTAFSARVQSIQSRIEALDGARESRSRLKYLNTNRQAPLIAF